MSFLELEYLVSHGRDDAWPVARTEAGLFTWADLRRRIAQYSASLTIEKRQLLADAMPTDFLAHLLAVWQGQGVAVIPPNLQHATLERFAHRPGTETGEGVCLELHTSGSTGEPKCIGKSLRQLGAECRVLENLWGIGASELGIVATIPHYHIYGLLFRLLWPLCAGRVFDALTASEPVSLQQRLAAVGRCFLVSSPAQLSRLPDLWPLAEWTIRPERIFSSGGPLSATAANLYHSAWGDAPTEVLGSTETGGIAWRQRCGADDDLWTAMPGVSLDQQENGALRVRSPFLPDDDFFVMDDAVAFIEDGRFRLLGRMDRIIKLEEKRLSLPEMEACLMAHPWVEAAALLPCPTERRTVLGAVLVRSAGAPASRSDLIAGLKTYLRGHYDPVLLPRRWRLAAQLPYNAGGKLILKQLQAMFADDPQLPEIHAMQLAENAGSFELDIHPTLPHFAGHFPGLPILPGIVQVDWSVRLARKYLGVAAERFSAIKMLKFLQPIRPGYRVQLQLTWSVERGRLDFSFTGDGSKFSSGQLFFGTAGT